MISAIKQYRGQQLPDGTFQPPDQYETAEGVGQEQLVRYLEHEEYSDEAMERKGQFRPKGMSARQMAEISYKSLPAPSRQQAIEGIQHMSTPEGLRTVRDDAVADSQVRGLMLHRYGDATKRPDGGDPFMLSEAGQPIALKDLPNDPQNPVHGRTDAKGNPIGFRDWTIERLRRQKNAHTRAAIQSRAEEIYTKAQESGQYYVGLHGSRGQTITPTTSSGYGLRVYGGG